jgi:hypothetical protein
MCHRGKRDRLCRCVARCIALTRNSPIGWVVAEMILAAPFITVKSATVTAPARQAGGTRALDSGDSAKCREFGRRRSALCTIAVA